MIWKKRCKSNSAKPKRNEWLTRRVEVDIIVESGKQRTKLMEKVCFFFKLNYANVDRVSTNM